jgi:acyl carrier protein
MTQDRVRQIIADVLEVPVARLRDDMAPDTTPGWDSLRHLDLVTALEDELSIQFAPEDVDSMRCVGDVLHAVARKLGR